MEIKPDPELLVAALRAAYQGQPQAEIGLFFHKKVAETLVARAANLWVSLKQGSDGFVEWAGDAYGYAVGEVEAEAAQGRDLRAGVPGIPVPGVRVGFDSTVKLDPDIWSRVKDAMGECRSVESAKVHAATLLEAAGKLWVLCTLDRDSFLFVARHFHEDIALHAIPKLVN